MDDGVGTLPFRHSTPAPDGLGQSPWPARNADWSFPSVLGPKERLRLRLYCSLILLDLSSLAVAFAIANFFRFGTVANVQGRDFFLLLGPAFVAIAGNDQAFGLKALQYPKRGIQVAIRSLLITSVLLIGIIFYLKASESYSRQVLASGIALGVILVAAARWRFGLSAGRRHGWRFTNEIMIVDGAPIRPQPGELVMIADSSATGNVPRDPLAMDRLGKFLRTADRLILAAKPDRRAHWVHTLKGIGIDIEVLALEIDSLGPLELRHHGGHATLLVDSKPLGLRDRIKKRAFDLAIALPALTVLAPILLLIAFAIRLESPGPALFRQPRVGRGNRIFQICKFRSMRTEAADSAGDRSAARDDDRITRVGRLLRRTSLDELPQLLNVLAGDMSIVGPRPHALASRAEDALFWDIDRRYWERHGIKPGITGLAQVRGYRGATATRADVTNRVQSDLEYLVGWRLGRDLLIILRTLRVLVHPNAF